MDQFLQFLGEWGDAITAVVAIAALIQPWLATAWKRFFKPGRIEIYESGLIEVGYGALGPSIALLGTLKACHRDIFVRSICLTLIKDKDQSRHRFEWAVFRSSRVPIGKQDDTVLELPSSFMVMSTQPHRYHILFNDQARQEEMRPAITTFAAAWISYQQAAVSQGKTPEQAYSSFALTPEHVTAFTNLDRLFYWEPGTYRLSLTVQIEGAKSFAKSWSFVLSPEDEKNLRFNPITVLREICGQPVRNTFAYIRYQ